MNTIRVMGGLGNQLFQYAFGRAQMQNGIDVSFDVSFYGKDLQKATSRLGIWPRHFRLNRFNCEQYLRIGPMVNGALVREKKNMYSPSLLKLDGKNFDGYWQYPGYYQSILPLLREEFLLKEIEYTQAFRLAKESILQSNSVGVHVRRGDYVFQKGFHNLPFDYYLRAISKTEGDLFIFSDDIPWCKEKFNRKYFTREITFISTEDYLDFELLRFCKQKVIANSTFSWWAAFLGEDHQVVVAPSGWTTGSRELNQIEQMKEADLIYYPAHWIKL